MIKGNNRRMFRKPGLARQAIGILASSKELMDEVQPVRMVAGGDPALEQARQQVLASGISPTNPLFDQLVGRIYSNTTQSPLAVRGGASSLSQYLSSPTLGDFLPTRRQPPPQDFRQTGEYLPDLGDPVEIIGGGIRGLVQGGGARDESGTGEPIRRRIKAQGTPRDISAGITSVLEDAARSVISEPVRMGQGNPPPREEPSAVDRLSRTSSIISQPTGMGPEAVRSIEEEREERRRQGDATARGTAEFQEKMSPSDLALDTRRLNAERPKLNRAQRRLNTAQRAYDKVVANGTEEQQAEALASLTQAQNEVKRLAPIVADLEETVGTGKRKQTLDRFFGQLEDINRQLADENISDKARQKLLEQRDKVQSRMEEAGIRKFEPDDTDLSDRPQKPVPEIDAQSDDAEDSAKADETRARLETDAVIENIAGGDDETIKKLQEENKKIDEQLSKVESGLADKPSPEETEVVKKAMESAGYDEKEVRENIRKDSFWNAVMIAGLQMAAGASEGGDRFSNMARAAIIGLDEFNKDVKQKEKSAYQRYRDKKADELAERKFELQKKTSDVQAQQLVLQTLSTRQRLNSSRIAEIQAEERLAISRAGEERAAGTASFNRSVAINEIVQDRIDSATTRSAVQKRIAEEKGVDKLQVTEQEIRDRIRRDVQKELFPPNPSDTNDTNAALEEARRRGLIK